MPILFGLFFLTMLLLPATAVAQATMVGVSSAWEVGFTVYALMGAMVAGVITWALSKLAGYLNVKIQNETVAGVLQRLVGSISDAVAMVDQTVRANIESSKKADSPGGVKITKREKDEMLSAVWTALKTEYGGWDGIFSLLKKIGVGDEKSARAKISTMIEASVNTQNLRKKVAGAKPPDPT